MAGVASFYGADSVAAYDGNLQTGAAAITAAFVQPRVSAMAGGERVQCQLRVLRRVREGAGDERCRRRMRYRIPRPRL